MIKKIAGFLFPAAVLVLFILIMQSGTVYKQPVSENDDVMGYLIETTKDVQAADWQKAAVHLQALKKAWQIVLSRIQISIANTEADSISDSISRIQGYISAQDKSGALAELSKLKSDWQKIGR